jgi:hypothetical protein
MLKIIKHILLIFTLILSFPAFSQNPALQIIDQKDINKLNEQLQKSLKKCKCCLGKDTNRMFTFFRLFSKSTIFKEEFIDGSFLQKLTPKFHYQYDIQLDHIDTISKEIENGYVLTSTVFFFKRVISNEINFRLFTTFIFQW